MAEQSGYAPSYLLREILLRNGIPKKTGELGETYDVPDWNQVSDNFITPVMITPEAIQKILKSIEAENLTAQQEREERKQERDERTNVLAEQLFQEIHSELCGKIAIGEDPSGINFSITNFYKREDVTFDVVEKLLKSHNNELTQVSAKSLGSSLGGYCIVPTDKFIEFLQSQAASKNQSGPQLST